MPPFPVFVEKTFRLMTPVTLPLALLSIGGALKFANLKGMLTPSLLASALKLFVLPAIGYALFKAFSISGMQFKAGMIFFVLPTSTAIYVLSSQLNSDTELASASIVVSTVISSVSMSIMLIILDKIA
jgi:hypothetical protein